MCKIESTDRESELGAANRTLVSTAKTPATDTINVKLETADKNEKEKEEMLDMNALEICDDHESNKRENEQAKNLIIYADTKVVGDSNIEEDRL